MTTTLYIDSKLDVDELSSLVADVVGKPASFRSIEATWGDLDIGDDARAIEHTTDDADDFLNWPYYIATNPGRTVSEAEFLQGVHDLREGLVSRGVRVLIVSDLDHVFPPGWTPDG